MSKVTAEQLLSLTAKVEDVELEGLGTVTVRGLTRKEVLDIQDQMDDPAEADARSLSLVFVDPKLTIEQARQLQTVVSAGSLEPLNEAVARLSGMKPGAMKEAVKRFR